MNKFAVTAVFLSVLLVAVSMESASALSPSQMKYCVSKIPKDFTFAERNVAIKKCNMQERTYGKIPPGFEPLGDTFSKADLVMLCVNLKMYPKKTESQYKQVVQLAKEMGYDKYCKIMWKDKIWSGKKY